jgi:hypothetical protein
VNAPTIDAGFVSRPDPERYDDPKLEMARHRGFKQGFDRGYQHGLEEGRRALQGALLLHLRAKFDRVDGRTYNRRLQSSGRPRTLARAPPRGADDRRGLR